MYKRRTFLKGLLYAGALAAAPGCTSRIVRPPNCPHFSNPDGTLVIDAHCHIFNASDLQVAGFINDVKLKLPDTSLLGLIGEAVQRLGWRFAPSAGEELKWLRSQSGPDPDSLSPLVGATALQSTVLGMGRSSDERYVEFWRELLNQPGFMPDEITERLASHQRAYATGFVERAVTGPDVRQALMSPSGIAELIAIEQTYRPGGVAIVTFLKTFFRFRTENAFSMLTLYGCESRPGVDMLVPAMVDFDLWLGDSSLNRGYTKSSIESQLEVMAQLSRATRGRVHVLAPFNPLRFACAGDDGLDEYIDSAVDTFGALGFKLYPPMGFAAAGNLGAEPLRIPGCPSGDAVGQVDSASLDRTLGKFFDRCSERDIPVMAHASHSNGAYEGSARLAAPMYWGKLLGSHRTAFESGASRVRINLGHMGGGTDSHSDGNPGWRDQIASLMKRHPGQVFGDVGYFDGVMGDQQTREAQWASMKSFADPAVWPHVMFGTDWSMIAAVPGAATYLSAFSSFYDTFISPSLEDGVRDKARRGFFGENARRFFGLDQGGRGLARLAEFHTPEAMAELESMLLVGRADAMAHI